MCGIAGIISFDGSPVEVGDLERMVEVIRHRGPDENGTYVSPDGRCGLGHARLSIIDLAEGRQPMSNEDGTIWISYNGECYNFAELRKELIAAGHEFRTNCDTEVVVHLYEQYGDDFVRHMRGMFAVAIWDENKRELVLARDRMGQKPLFFTYNQDRLIFASELKAILAIDKLAGGMHKTTIAEYLLYGYIGSTWSGFSRIIKIPPAGIEKFSIDSFDMRNRDIRPPYWHLPQERKFKGSYAEAVRQVRETVTDAVRMRMMSDVPLGSFLSGGIDSTIITGIMSKFSKEPVKTCGIGFEEGLYNELDYSRAAAEAFGCDHVEHIVKPDCAETVQKLVDFYDEPFADASALPTFHLCRLTRERVTVALSGDGGDECFGGYRRHKGIRAAAMVRHNVFLRLIAGMKCWQKIASGEHHSRLHYLKRFMAAASKPVHECYINWLGIFETDMLAEIVKDPPMDVLAMPAECCFESDSDKASAAMYFDGMHYLPGDLNTKVDRASMAHSLEVRSPFEDHKVVELAYSLPPQWLVGGKNGKKILRDAFADILPPMIKERGKMGFGVPVGKWFRSELREMYADVVLSGSLVDDGIINGKTAEKLMVTNDSQQADNGDKMWALLMLQLWADKWTKNA